MNRTSAEFVLDGLDGEPPVLIGVQAHGRLEGVLFDLTLRQTYRNAGTTTLEVVYTFPLPVDAVLLGFAAELGDKRLEGIVLSRPQAEHQYEDALAEGDTPVMLEALGQGTYSANIGNLLPGEQLVLEVRMAQLLRFDQGRLRLRIPTTFAPRHGSPARAGLQAHQVPVHSASIEQPLSLSITVAGSLSQALIECPTHPMQRQATADGIQLALAAPGWLDRDVVVLITPEDPRPPLLMRATDDANPAAPGIVMAALQAPAAPPNSAIRLRLLVDRSGSMAGDSLASAKRALVGVLAALQPHDTISLSGFGFEVEHHQAPTLATPSALRRLRLQIGTLSANLGGTEMAAALREVLAVGPSRPTDGAETADVLLITDGEVWDTDALVNQTRATGHRVFAIGVGSTPAEGVLRALAEATGGAYELATPGEDLERAALRMIERMRQQPWRDLSVDWGTPAAWATPLPAALYGGDTLITMAGMSASAAPASLQITAAGPAGDRVVLARVELAAHMGPHKQPTRSRELARVAAAQRVGDRQDAAAGALALQYQLLGPQTMCVLVHRRAEADKAQEPAELHRVSSMLAAGWSGMGSVSLAQRRGPQFEGITNALIWRSKSPRSIAAIESLSSPGVATEGVDDANDAIASMRRLALAVAQRVRQGGPVGEQLKDLEALVVDTSVSSALDALCATGLGRLQAWIVLADWIWQQLADKPEPTAGAALSRAAAAIAHKRWSVAVDELQRRLGDQFLIPIPDFMRKAKVAPPVSPPPA